MENLNIHFVAGPLWSQISTHIMMCLIAIINGWQIIILKKRGRKTSFETLLLSLSLCELMMAIVGIIIAATLRIEALMPYHVLMEATWIISSSCVVLSEYFHLLAITFDRTLAIVTPLKHRSYVTNKKIVFTCIFCSFMPVVWVSIYVAVFFLKRISPGNIEDYYKSEFCFHGSIITIFVDITLMMCYSVMIHTISKRDRNPVGESNERVRHLHAKTLFLCISYAAVFVIATTPFVIVFLVPHKLPEWMVNSIMSFFTLNSFFNSLVFLIQHYYKKRQITSRIGGT